MPSIPDEFIPLRTTTPQEPSAAPDDPGFLQTLGAAGTVANWPYRAWRYLDNRATVQADPNYDPFPEIKGTKYESDPERFAFARDATETAAIKREWDQDENANAILAKSGWVGTVTRLGMGLADPTVFLPIAKIFSGVAAGANALRIGADVAMAGARDAAIGEAVMYATTPEYTAVDFAQNVGTQTLLAGFLGAGAGALISRGERKALEDTLHADREAWGADIAASQSPAAQSVGAAASDTRKLEMDTPSFLTKLPDPTAKLSPPRRVLNSDFETARRATVDLAETPYIFKENAEGVATMQGPAVDRIMKLEDARAKVGMARDFDRLYTQYRFGDEGAGRVQKVVTGVQDVLGKDTGGKMTFAQWKDAVDYAMRNGDVHDIPSVAEAAKLSRDNIIVPWRDRAVKAGLLPDDLEVETADSYLMRLWNKEKITAQRPEFITKVADWYQGEQTRKAGLQEKLLELSQKLDQSDTSITNLERKAKGGTQEHIDAIAQSGALREQIEQTLKEWKGKSASEALSAMKVRDKEPRDPGKPRLASADNAVSKAMRRIVESDRNFSRQELEARANETADRILGNPDGRITYDDATPSTGGAAGDSPRGPLARRVFMIPDNMIRDFLETDVQHTLEAYLRTMIPDVLLTEKFGDAEMSEVFRKLKDEAAAKQAAAKTEAARTKIKKQYDATVTDLAAMRDRIRHTYGYSSDPRARMMGRIASTAARFDMITNLGGAALSSLADLAGLQWRYGFATTFRDAWRPMLKSLVDPELRAQLKQYKSQMQTLGIAAETYLATRSNGLHDVLDVYKPTSKFERATAVMADKFGLASMLTPWTDFGKFAAGMVSGAEISKAADAIATGKGTARQIRNLAEAGIDGVMADRIAKQLARDGGSDLVNGVRLPNTANWTDKGAREAFEGALARDVDIMIMTPGQEKPLIMSNPVASLLLQYKTFVVAANERLLVRSLQARDHQALQGAASAILLGMLAEYAYSFVANREAPKEPADWIKAGINRSGILGWYTEGNSIVSKWTAGAADAYRLIGATQPDSRYVSRTPLGALLGPVANKAETTVKSMSILANKALGGDAEWKASDTYNLRRMVAGQNLFYIRRLLDAGEDQVNEWLGVEPKERGR